MSRNLEEGMPGHAGEGKLQVEGTATAKLEEFSMFKREREKKWAAEVQ